MKNLFLFSVLVAGFVVLSCGGGSPSKSDACDITEFKVSGVNFEVKYPNITHFYKKNGVNQWENQPSGLVAPEIKFSDKATIDPPLTAKFDFLKDGEIVQYTVTAEDGKTSKTYSVKVTLGTL